jgi:hypothetical protein
MNTLIRYRILILFRLHKATLDIQINHERHKSSSFTERNELMGLYLKISAIEVLT